jgi:hypothetical protein
MTLCLVVLARHVEKLQFIDIMLGDQPALSPQQAAYQRMLTGDPIEAIEQARSFLKKGSVEGYYEEIVLGALRLAAADAALGRLDDARLENIHQTVSEIIEDLGSQQRPAEQRLAKQGGGPPSSRDMEGRKPGRSVFCIPGLGRLDDCAALVVADFLKRRDVFARTATTPPATKADTADTICVCFLEEVTEARTDFTRRKLSRQAPSADVLVCLFGATVEQNGPEAEPSEASPHSLAAVLATIEKKAMHLTRQEQ